MPLYTQTLSHRALNKRQTSLESGIIPILPFPFTLACGPHKLWWRCIASHRHTKTLSTACTCCDARVFRLSASLIGSWTETVSHAKRSTFLRTVRTATHSLTSHKDHAHHTQQTPTILDPLTRCEHEALEASARSHTTARMLAARLGNGGPFGAKITGLNRGSCTASLVS